MIITPTRRQISDVLLTGFYQIPRFQRPYRWKRQHVDEFWVDLSTEKPGEHFIGSLILHKRNDGVSEIIDGQQRLTTIMLLLSVVRDDFRRLGREDLARGTHGYIERTNIEFKPMYVVHPTSSYPYLHEHILKWDKPEVVATAGTEELLLRDAYDTLVGLVREYCVPGCSGTFDNLGARTQKTAIKRLTDIRDRVLKLHVIHVELTTEEDACFVFETLNTRGMDLKQTDLIKNHVMRQMPPRSANVDLARDRWDKLMQWIEESAAEIDPDKFLLHHWLSRHDYTSAKKLFRVVKRSYNGRAQVNLLLDELWTDAKVYRAALEPDSRKWRSDELHLKTALNALNEFGVEQELPMVIAVLRSYSEHKLSLKSTRRIICAIERFHFVFTAITSQRSSGGISAMYASAARRLTSAVTSQERAKTIDALIAKLKTKRPTYAEFEANFIELKCSSEITKHKALTTYVLRRITETLLPATALNYEQMTIEHLAPEHPPKGSPWRVPKDAVAEIGNLLLVSQRLNEKLGTRPLPDKQRILRTNRNLAWIDEAVTRAKQWNSRAIRARSKAIARLAYDSVWKL